MEDSSLRSSEDLSVRPFVTYNQRGNRDVDIAYLKFRGLKTSLLNLYTPRQRRCVALVLEFSAVHDFGTDDTSGGVARVDD